MSDGYGQKTRSSSAILRIPLHRTSSSNKSFTDVELTALNSDGKVEFIGILTGDELIFTGRKECLSTCYVYYRLFIDATKFVCNVLLCFFILELFCF